jgi:hypothetical protein
MIAKMNLEDFKRFDQSGQGTETPIARLSAEMVRHLNASSGDVLLHHAYLRKAIEKHGMAIAQLPMISETIDHGRALADRPSHITFLHFDETIWKRWFHVTVKVAGESRLVYVATFYKTDLKEVVRKSKRHPWLRE